MPSKSVCGRMYTQDEDYSVPQEGYSTDLDDRLRATLDALAKLPPGTIIDYGCGRGDIVRAAAELGWQSFGVEFSSQIAAKLSADIGVPVTTLDALDLRGARADVVVLNDVLEHMTELDDEFRSILSHLRPGGLVMAQGPLEGNANLFLHAVATFRRLKGSPRATTPPYHVLLATARGQRVFFRRSGLKELRYTVTEVAWPAPDRLPPLRDRRLFALYWLRSASQLIGRVVPAYSGNRYFYIGERTVTNPLP